MIPSHYAILAANWIDRHPTKPTPEQADQFLLDWLEDGKIRQLAPTLSHDNRGDWMIWDGMRHCIAISHTRARLAEKLWYLERAESRKLKRQRKSGFAPSAEK